MDVFDTRDELISKQQNSLEREFAVAEVEKIFETGAKEIKDHGVVVTFCAKPADKRDPNTAGKGLIDAGFVFELWMLRFDALELNGDLFAGDDVCTFRVMSAYSNRQDWK